MEGKNNKSSIDRTKFNDDSFEFQFFQTYNNGTTLKDKKQLELKHFDDYQQGIDFFTQQNISRKALNSLTNFTNDFTIGNNKINNQSTCVCNESSEYDNPCADQIKDIISEINCVSHRKAASDSSLLITDSNLTKNHELPATTKEKEAETKSRLIEKVTKDKDLSDLVMMLHNYKKLIDKEMV